mmetsp:Transcript_56199/g.182394  ORF Transcript_56199/g.182394 Transcript_56199/m.182394 type:complete len:115 (-) Transcript_56199:549-893(-)
MESHTCTTRAHPQLIQIPLAHLETPSSKSTPSTLGTSLKSSITQVAELPSSSVRPYEPVATAKHLEPCTVAHIASIGVSPITTTSHGLIGWPSKPSYLAMAIGTKLLRSAASLP